MGRRATTTPPGRLSRAEYYAWVEQQPRGRFERIDGEVVAMAPERAVHALVKHNVAASLRAAVRAAAARCQVFPDGMTVAIGAETDYEPDCVVQCGERVAFDAVAVLNPILIVEVESPPTAGTDTGIKLSDYFRLPSVMHYLIVRTRKRLAVHHRRDAGGIATAIVGDGPLTFAPPGITVDLAAFYDDVDLNAT